LPFVNTLYTILTMGKKSCPSQRDTTLIRVNVNDYRALKESSDRLDISIAEALHRAILNTSEEEQSVLNCLRAMCKHGYGRIEIVVVGDKIDRITPSPVFSKKAGDFALIGEFSAAVGTRPVFSNPKMSLKGS